MAPQQTHSTPKVGVQAAAVISGSFLSGAMASLSMMVIPVLLDTNPDPSHTLRQWVRLYHYGHIILPALSVGTCGLYSYAALSGRSPRPATYAKAALATIIMVPFTWLVMVPTNNTLFGLEASGPSVTAADWDMVQGLVVRWAWLHATRSVAPLVGAIVGFRGLIREFGP
ncbi:hypothetical protein NKR23_g7294 [Pleurostoma richardsiae]|uniref:DUF1772-domain-containing protein n=1 Tax=Pleurostoma richardsiae TaxID=41990 RepID=A0AA38VDL9_9PEZI|nr:hypothetical protein NKR23_g7294 [Pleurostoma richardsiae]